MRPQQLQDTLTARVKLQIEDGVKVRPAYVVGPPGVGKTQVVGQTAADMGIAFHALHAPLMLNEDFGMPNLSGGEVVFATPSHKFPFVDSDHFAERGILLIDEVAQCTPDQQKIWANLFQERELHGRKLKPGWAIVASGNRMKDRAGAGRILSHFNDRFTTYEMEPSLDDWCQWALTKGGVRPEVVGFLRFRPDLLSAFDPDKEKSPTPRAWAEGVSPVLDAVPAAALHDTIKGDVGEGAAAEFAGFLATYRGLPDPDLVIANAATHPIPSEMHILYALAGALAHRTTKDNFADVLKFANRMPPEFTILVVRDATRLNRELEDTRAYVEWSIGPGADILLNN